MSALCARERVSTLCGLLGVWAALMCHLSGQDELVLGQPYSVQARHAELQGVVGCFATPLPVRISILAQEVPFSQLLHAMYVELLQAVDHANVPLFRIVQAFGPKRSTTHNPLFQSIVQLLPHATPWSLLVRTSQGVMRKTGAIKSRHPIPRLRYDPLARARCHDYMPRATCAWAVARGM